MRQWLALGVMAVLLLGGGWLWSQSGDARAGQAFAVPSTGQPVPESSAPLIAPVSDVTPADREARRFNRYDKDRDGEITREEYFVSRRKAYARLDLDADGKLSFDEYNAKAAKKFATADADHDTILAAAEFVTTAVKRRARELTDCRAPNTDNEKEG